MDGLTDGWMDGDSHSFIHSQGSLSIVKGAEFENLGAH